MNLMRMQPVSAKLGFVMLLLAVTACQTRKDKPVNMRCGTNEIVTPDGCAARPGESLIAEEPVPTVTAGEPETESASAHDAGVTGNRHIADDYRPLHTACSQIAGAQPESDACLCPDGGRLHYSHYVDELDQFEEQCQRQ